LLFLIDGQWRLFDDRTVSFSVSQWSLCLYKGTNHPQLPCFRFIPRGTAKMTPILIISPLISPQQRRYYYCFCQWRWRAFLVGLFGSLRASCSPQMQGWSCTTKMQGQPQCKDVCGKWGHNQLS
jgi:hypothetical protein